MLPVDPDVRPPEPPPTDERVGEIAHALNNLLQIIDGNLELLDAPAAAGRVATAREAVARARELAAELVQAAVEAPRLGAEVRVAGTVLVVDDEPAILELTTTALERNDFVVHRALGGEAAVREYRRLTDEGVLDAVVLDLSMPGLSGEEAWGQMRAINHSVPVVVVSGYPAAVVSRRLGDVTPAGVVSKPAPMHVLVSAVRRAVAERYGGRLST